MKYTVTEQAPRELCVWAPRGGGAVAIPATPADVVEAILQQPDDDREVIRRGCGWVASSAAVAHARTLDTVTAERNAAREASGARTAADVVRSWRRRDTAREALAIAQAERDVANRLLAVEREQAKAERDAMARKASDARSALDAAHFTLDAAGVEGSTSGALADRVTLLVRQLDAAREALAIAQAERDAMARKASDARAAADLMTADVAAKHRELAAAKPDEETRAKLWLIEWQCNSDWIRAIYRYKGMWYAHGGGGCVTALTAANLARTLGWEG